MKRTIKKDYWETALSGKRKHRLIELAWENAEYSVQDHYSESTYHPFNELCAEAFSYCHIKTHERTPEQIFNALDDLQYAEKHTHDSSSTLFQSTASAAQDAYNIIRIAQQTAAQMLTREEAHAIIESTAFTRANEELAAAKSVKPEVTHAIAALQSCLNTVEDLSTHGHRTVKDFRKVDRAELAKLCVALEKEPLLKKVSATVQQALTLEPYMKNARANQVG